MPASFPANMLNHDSADSGILTDSDFSGPALMPPILIDQKKQIIAGHGRYEAAELSGCTQVPVICLEHLTEAQCPLGRHRQRPR